MDPSPTDFNKYSLWFESPATPRPSHSPYAQETDIVVVGAGMTGLHTALALKKAGHSVTVLDAKKPGSGTTGHSSAHASAIQDAGYDRISTRHGDEAATLIAEVLRSALDEIELRGDACDWSRVPAYLYAASDEDVVKVEREVQALGKVGFNAVMIDSAPFPTKTLPAARIANQGTFHPLKYLAALENELIALGVPIVTGAHAISAKEKDSGITLTTTENAILAQHVVMATHHPWSLVTEAEAIPYRSYLVAMEAEQPLEPGLYWDTADPYHYLRNVTVNGEDLILIGGSDHRTGFFHEKDWRAYAALESYARNRVGATRTRYQWSAQYYEPVDDIPFIGRAPNRDRLWMATGYSGNGLAFGIAAGKLLADAITGSPHRLLDYLNPSRATPATTADFVAEGVKTGYRYLRDRVFREGKEAMQTLAPGQGDIFKIDGELIAASRNDDGKIVCRSAICTHMGGVVQWNPLEQTWDCPIHGGRFSAKGKWLEGPPPKNLEHKG